MHRDLAPTAAEVEQADAWSKLGEVQRPGQTRAKPGAPAGDEVAVVGPSEVNYEVSGVLRGGNRLGSVVRHGFLARAMNPVPWSDRPSKSSSRRKRVPRPRVTGALRARR